MKKVITLTERDLTKLVSRIINEQPENLSTSKRVNLGHPIDNPLWKELDNWVNGDGPEVIKYIPNKLLVIGYWDGTKYIPDYTITKH